MRLGTQMVRTLEFRQVNGALSILHTCGYCCGGWGPPENGFWEGSSPGCCCGVPYCCGACKQRRLRLLGASEASVCILLQPNALITCDPGWDDFILPTITGGLRKAARVLERLYHGRWRGRPWREAWHAGHAWSAVHGGRLMWRRGAAVDRHRRRQRLRLLSHLAPEWSFLHVQRLTFINSCQTGR